ncbi:hypothetical protein FE784_06825 [Paenibacillus hemerocallicola]|uniref:Uncharacterized protein n=1 Tax=Paenibacillus hemerocallicola TaxID=1172614 RepID=A0A5C4TDI0_9BACL|nr:hypothetical protein [Paenibacillus hemerocallicola]TNJ66912.1 hypothetical protein FE784_06825 [Paenibacillus hemerocallicola]
MPKRSLKSVSKGGADEIEAFWPDFIHPCHNKVGFSTVRIVFPLRADFSARFNLISFSKPGFDRNLSICVTNKVGFSTIRIGCPLCADFSAHLQLE